MKKIICCVLFAIFSFSAFCQTTQDFDKEHYLKKRKTQNTIGWVLAGTGAGLIVVSFATIDVNDFGDAIFNGDDSGLNTSAALFVTGCVVAVSSIPFFIAAGKNKKKAMSISFKLQSVPQLKEIYLTNFKTPSLTLKVQL